MSPNFPSRRVNRTVVLVCVGLTCVLVGIAVWIAAHPGLLRWHVHRTIRIPEKVLLEDFQRTADREWTEQLLAVEQTGVGKFIDVKLLKPFLDDAMTREMSVAGVELRRGQFPDRPELHRIVAECARILHLPPPRVFIVNQPGAKAYATNLVDPMIVVHSELLRSFHDPLELRFLIGHEMAHIRCRHVKWQMILRAIAAAVRGTKGVPDEVALLPFLPLFNWSREAEMSADNAGLICCQDLPTAERALMRLALNLDEGTIGRLDVEVYLAQRRGDDLSKFSEVMRCLRQSLQDHPDIPDRIIALRKYATTRQYQHLWE